MMPNYTVLLIQGKSAEVKGGTICGRYTQLRVAQHVGPAFRPDVRAEARTHMRISLSCQTELERSMWGCKGIRICFPLYPFTPS
jgi:hypothetical protein